MTNGTTQKPDSDQTDRILVAVERMVDKKIESDVRCHRETNSVHAKSALGGYLAVAITLGVGAGGIIADTYLKNRDRDDQVLRGANQRKLEIISGISNAITSMREYKDLVLISCETKALPEQAAKIKEERLKRAYDLVKSFRPVVHFFSDRFRTLIREFLAWDDAIENYCNRNAPSEEEWRKRQKEIEDQMVLAPTHIFVEGYTKQQ